MIDGLMLGVVVKSLHSDTIASGAPPDGPKVHPIAMPVLFVSIVPTGLVVSKQSPSSPQLR
jgi:hypothetical protein